VVFAPIDVEMNQLYPNVWCVAVRIVVTARDLENDYAMNVMVVAMV